VITRFDRPALALITFWVFIWCADAWWGSSSWWYHDLAHHHYPWRAWSGGQWAAGNLPLWAPIGHGFPFVAESQGGALYMPNILLWMFFSNTVAFNWSIGLHHLLALWGAYSLARYDGRSSTAALVAAVAYGFSGFFVSHLVYLGFFQVMAWFPWMLLAAIQGARFGGAWWALLALSTGMVWLCGHPQAAYLATLATLLVLGLRALQVRRVRGWRPLLGGGFAMLLAAGLSLPQWGATLELLQHGVRGGGLGSSVAALGSLPPEELFNAVLPRLFGYERPIDIPMIYGHRGGGYLGRGVSYWETCFYLGVPTVLMLLFAGWSRRTRTWWVLGGAGLIVMLGSYTPLFGLIQWIPGMELFRFPVRAAMWVTVAAAMLAAAGVDRLSESARDSSNWGKNAAWAGLLVVMLAGCLLGAANLGLRQAQPSLQGWLTERLVRSEPTAQGGEPRDQAAAMERATALLEQLKQSTNPLSSHVGWALLLAFASTLPWLLVRRGSLRPGAPAQLIVGVLITDLFLFGFEFVPRISAEDIDSRPESTVPLLGLSANFRMTTVEKRVPVERMRQLLPSSLGLQWGVDDVGIPSPLRMKRNERYLEAAGVGFAPMEPRLRWERLWRQKHLLDLSGVRFIFSTSESRADGLHSLWSGDGVWLYENREALPRAFLVGCTEKSSGEDAFEAVLRNTKPGRLAVVEGNSGLASCSLEPVGSVAINAGRPGNWSLEVEAHREGWLVLTESYYPGFKWVIDGREAPYFRTNYLFQGTPISAGSHKVTISYRPMWFFAALALSWLMAVAILGWMMLGRLPGAHRVLVEIPALKPEELDEGPE
jgi:hypothetical protein